MDFNKGRIVRFYSGGKRVSDTTLPNSDPSKLDRSSSTFKLPSSHFVSGGSKSAISTDSLLFGKPTGGGTTSKLVGDEQRAWSKRILDPGSEIMLKWNKVFIFMCLLALFIDPLYFYLPGIAGDGKTWCVNGDSTLRITLTLFRTMADMFYFLHMIVKFRTAYVAPSSRVFGRGELVMDPIKIARRYIRSDFFIDLVAALPLPQGVGP